MKRLSEPLGSRRTWAKILKREGSSALCQGGQGQGSPEMSENSSALKFCSPSRGRLMKACMAGERRMTPLLACLSRLSRYLQREGPRKLRLAFSDFCTTTQESRRKSARGWGGEERQHSNLFNTPKLLYEKRECDSTWPPIHCACSKRSILHSQPAALFSPNGCTLLVLTLCWVRQTGSHWHF